MAFRKSAVASQQRWFLTTRTAWQLVQLLRCREAIRFRLLVDDLRRRATARVLYRRLGRARLIVTGRAAVVAARVFATGLAVTRCAITRAAALGRRGTGGAAAAVARGVLATALWLAATWSACALGRSPWTTATALGRFGLGHVVDAVTEVIDIVVKELVRGAVGRSAWWLARLAITDCP